jgi:hypothetical protein
VMPTDCSTTAHNFKELKYIRVNGETMMMELKDFKGKHKSEKQYKE